MGCFNDGCFVSGIPITHYDEAKIFFLKEISQDSYDLSKGSIVYPWEAYNFLNFPIVGTYDDYGGYDIDESQLEFQQLLSFLKKNIKHIEKGANEYHDIEVDPEKLDVKLINEAMHEGRLIIESKSHLFKGENRIKRCAVHVDIFDEIVQKTSNQWHNWKHSHGNFEYVKTAMISKYFRDILREKRINARMYDNIEDWKDKKFGVTWDDHFDYENTKRPVIPENFTFPEMTTYNFNMEYFESFIPIINENTTLYEFDKIMDRITEMSIFVSFLTTNNMPIIPSMYAGQGVDYDQNIEFHQTCIDFAKTKKKEWD